MTSTNPAVPEAPKDLARNREQDSSAALIGPMSTGSPRTTTPAACSAAGSAAGASGSSTGRPAAASCLRRDQRLKKWSAMAAACAPAPGFGAHRGRLSEPVCQSLETLRSLPLFLLGHKVLHGKRLHPLRHIGRRRYVLHGFLGVQPAACIVVAEADRLRHRHGFAAVLGLGQPPHHKVSRRR